jgi:hypothetical protein
VGSEMCIRDRVKPRHLPGWCHVRLKLHQVFKHMRRWGRGPLIPRWGVMYTFAERLRKQLRTFSLFSCFLVGWFARCAQVHRAFFCPAFDTSFLKFFKKFGAGANFPNFPNFYITTGLP